MTSASTPAASKPKASSSFEVRLKNCDFGFWNTLPTRKASSYISHAAGSRPQTRTSPVRSTAGSNWGMSPFTHLVIVVLPMPERPHRSTHSPRRTLKDTSSRMRDPSGAVHDTPRSSTTGASSARLAADARPRTRPLASAPSRVSALSHVAASSRTASFSPADARLQPGMRPPAVLRPQTASPPRVAALRPPAAISTHLPRAPCPPPPQPPARAPSSRRRACAAARCRWSAPGSRCRGT